MDEMMFYHTDELNNEISVIDEFDSLDLEINIGKNADAKDNSFAFSMSDEKWESAPILVGHRFYVPDTEYGGEITSVTHNTAKSEIKLEGVTWRGLLHSIIIEPPIGEAYLVLTNVDANEAIRQALDGRYSNIITVTSESAGVNVSASWRYKDVADALNKTFADYDLRLAVVWDNSIGKMILSAEPVDTLTDEIELSQDYGVDFTSVDGSPMLYNRVLALGRGEMTERLVVNVYYYNGSYYTTKPSGWDESLERTLIYDYPSAETESDLVSGAKDKLSKYIPVKSIEIDQISVGIPADLGDIIGARDRLTGMYGESKVVQKILSIKNGETTIRMGVE